MTTEEISEILKLHKAWINGEKHGKRAYLSVAYLSRAYLSRAENVPYTPMACPDEGEFTGWKKCKSDRIVKLKIPEDARRSSASRRKCRCDKAEVIEITSIDGKKNIRKRYLVEMLILCTRLVKWYPLTIFAKTAGKNAQQESTFS